MLKLAQTHPYPNRLLERYRLDCRQRQRASLVGSHVVRRRGQSLEFRELTPYMPGDDVRHVDWRASARLAGRDEYLVRRFMAEEQLTLVISVDARPSTELPEALPKLQIAAWLAEAVAWIALRSGDRVFLHSLFGRGWTGLAQLPAAASRSRIRGALQRFASGSPASAPNLGVLRPYLPPTAVWLILTDFYFGVESGNLLARRLNQAQDGLCWVVLADLDSWPHERALLHSGANLIEGPDLARSDPCDITDDNLRRVEVDIETHKARFLKLTGRAQCEMRWAWEAESRPDPLAFFQRHFATDLVLRRLFMRDS